MRVTLRTNKELLENADKGGYAVGAFNINNMEILQAVVDTAEEMRSPVIIQATEGAIKYAGIDYIYSMVKTAEETHNVPMSLHLDHGKKFDAVLNCIRHGFSSVMYDGSSLPFEENIKNTRKVVEIAHPLCISVEGELGTLKGVEDNVSVSEKDAFFTVPEEAVRFVEQTGIDALAIAIGTSHGAYKGKGEVKLDFERLEKIDKLVEIPLVLHGASGVSEEVIHRANAVGAQLKGTKGIDDASIKKAVSLGICKINIDTDLRLALTCGVRESLASRPENFDPRKILGPAREEIKKAVRKKMELFGSAGRA